MKMVPPMPKSMMAIDKAMLDPRSDLKALAATIEQDASLGSRVLQIVNSSYFGIARKVNDVQHAVTLLGVLTLRSVVMALESSRAFAGRGGLSVETQESIQTYCGFVAMLCRYIFSGDRLKAENAFTAGLLHEMGFMLLSANDEPRAQAEIENASVGAFMLGNWGLCHPVVEAVAFQDTPVALGHTHLEPADVLAIARQLLEEAGCSPPMGTLRSTLDGAFFDTRGIAETQLSLWRARAVQIASGGAT
jgi:HD-like signal output (HDOD) protein